MIATTRAEPRPLRRPAAVRPMTAPRTRWTQPHVVKSATMRPRPPTVTTWSLRIAASPHIALKKPAMNRMIAANETQPPAAYSSRRALVLRGAVVAMERGPFAGGGSRCWHRGAERSSPAPGDGAWADRRRRRHPRTGGHHARRGVQVYLVPVVSLFVPNAGP